MAIHIKNPQEIQKMKAAAKILAATFSILNKHIKPGMTTRQVDKIADDYIVSQGGSPSFKGYHGFPNACCTSVNEEVVHTIPSDKVLKDGDILTVDCGVYLNGFHSDSALTYFIGEVDDDTRAFVMTNRKVMQEACKMVRPGRRIGDISHFIHSYVSKQGYKIVKPLIGHGIGKNLHEEPEVPNYGRKGSGPVLKSGMTICIEPILAYSNAQILELDDGWTIVTADNGLACQEEHEVLVTDTGFEILTLREEENWL